MLSGLRLREHKNKNFLATGTNLTNQRTGNMGIGTDPRRLHDQPSNTSGVGPDNCIGQNRSF